MTTLMVAAGGGGDAVGAMLIRRLLGEDTQSQALISTCAWERLRIDPVPGPRSRGDFVGLRSIAGSRAEVVSTSDTLPPGRSVLPRLAGDLNARLFVHDFTGGVLGLGRQLKSLAGALAVDSITVVDVGGDLIARGGEPGLLSPLADSMTVAAAMWTGLPIRVAIVGPGVDGELSGDDVRHALANLHAEALGVVEPGDVETLRDVLSWHPTEATMLVAAAALGHRGAVDMRRGLDPVPVTDASASVWLLETPKLEDFPLGEALASTSSLMEAEPIMRRLAVNELDYERERASRSTGKKPDASTWEIARDSRERGAAFITTRRLLEAANSDCPNFEGARVDGLGLWSLDALVSGREHVLPKRDRAID